MAERTKQTAEIWDRCECGKVLHSILEAMRGECASCHWAKAPSDTKKAMKKLLSAAFTPTTDAEKDQVVKDAMDKLWRDKQAGVTS